jgi:rhamnogalacturonan endolyase
MWNLGLPPAQHEVGGYNPLMDAKRDHAAVCPEKRSSYALFGGCLMLACGSLGLQSCADGDARLGQPRNMQPPKAGKESPVLSATGGQPTGEAGRSGASVPRESDAGTVMGGEGFYRVEDLDRGVVAVATSAGVYVGWRMLGHEYDESRPEGTTYELFRDGRSIARVSDSTNYQDVDGSATSEYSVRASVNGAVGETSPVVRPWEQNYLRIALQPPSSGHDANDASAADVDGDGAYELILKWEPKNAKDNSQAGVTDNVFLDCIELDGSRRYRIDLGPNIRAGAHYTQFIAYDFDGDGKAELAIKTAPGTRDGKGAFLQLGPAAQDDDAEVFRNGDGYILSGPEYLTVFDGETGAERATTRFDVARGDVSDWGDDYGNRGDRFLATAAYLDDSGLPSFVMARGYYTRTTLTAWNFREGKLAQLWKFDSDDTPRDADERPFTGQGCHSLSVANTDADPQQEIVYGAMTVDHDGAGKCATGLGHGDALHVSDFLPERPGLESFMPHETDATPYWSLRDADSCEIIRQGEITDEDVGRGVAADILSESPGAELWSAGGVPLLNASSGERVGDTPSSINFVIWWDADETRELEDGTTIAKYAGATLQRCEACASNNGTKSTPTLSADLLGDWREEIIWREADNLALRLYTTTEVTQRRIYTLMHDPQYRVAISFQNVAYNQPPHPSFHIGAGMRAPPTPYIRTRR